MEQNIFSPFGFIEQIVLLVFILVLLVNMAGGKADSVLKALLGIFTSLFLTTAGLLCQLFGTVIVNLLNLIAIVAKQLLSIYQSKLATHTNRNSKYKVTILSDQRDGSDM